MVKRGGHVTMGVSLSRGERVWSNFYHHLVSNMPRIPWCVNWVSDEWRRAVAFFHGVLRAFLWRTRLTPTSLDTVLLSMRYKSLMEGNLTRLFPLEWESGLWDYMGVFTPKVSHILINAHLPSFSQKDGLHYCQKKSSGLLKALQTLQQSHSSIITSCLSPIIIHSKLPVKGQRLSRFGTRMRRRV